MNFCARILFNILYFKKNHCKVQLPKLNFHALRHSYASFMVSWNVNFKIIQEQLGHFDIKMTINTFSHLTKKDKNDASDHFDDLN